VVSAWTADQIRPRLAVLVTIAKRTQRGSVTRTRGQGFTSVTTWPLCMNLSWPCYHLRSTDNHNSRLKSIVRVLQLLGSWSTQTIIHTLHGSTSEREESMRVDIFIHSNPQSKTVTYQEPKISVSLYPDRVKHCMETRVRVGSEAEDSARQCSAVRAQSAQCMCVCGRAA
jgi:hypothetical protein